MGNRIYSKTYNEISEHVKQLNQHENRHNFSEKSLLTIFMAIKYMNFSRFLFSFGFYTNMYSMMKFMDAIPVLSWILFLNKIFLKMFASMYNYFNDIETSYNELKL